METIYDVFKQQVTAQTDAVAVMDEKKCLTYSELDAMATEIADGFPVKQPAKVGIVMSHSVEMIATILAALKSGAAYVPAEPSFLRRARGVYTCRWMKQQDRLLPSPLGEGLGVRLISSTPVVRRVSPKA